MTDKERLEIIKFLRNSEKTVAPGMQPSELISRKDVDWLINRVEELEQIIGDLDENVAAFETLWLEEKRKNQRYKQALEFYADEENYCVRFEDDYEPILQDNGKTARQALEGDEN
jgi:hypothetical protein